MYICFTFSYNIYKTFVSGRATLHIIHNTFLTLNGADSTSARDPAAKVLDEDLRVSPVELSQQASLLLGREAGVLCDRPQQRPQLLLGSLVGVLLEGLPCDPTAEGGTWEGGGRGGVGEDRMQR